MIDQDVEIRSRTLWAAFESWAKGTKTYGKMFDRLSDGTIKIIHDAFQEIDDIKPGTFDYWWCKNENRYSVATTNRQQRLAHELMYHFLTVHVRRRMKLAREVEKAEAKAGQAVFKRDGINSSIGRKNTKKSKNKT